MKKITCLLLALTCVFAMFSCGDKELDAFNEIIEASNPTQIVTQTTRVEDGITLSGKFTTVINGADYTTDYKYQRYARPEDAQNDSVTVNEDGVATVAGNIYYKDGLYSEDGENWESVAPDTAVLTIKFNLEKKYLSEYSIENNKLTATLTAEQAKEVLGVSLSTSGDITLVVTNTMKYVSNVLISYTAAPLAEGAEGARVIIETSYSYSPIGSAE